jgi:hypothetical protein
VNVNAQNANAIYQNAVADYNRFENGGVTTDQAKLQMEC